MALFPTSFCFNTVVTGDTFWLHTIISGYGLTGTADSQLLNIPPSFIYLAMTVFWRTQPFKGATHAVFVRHPDAPRPLDVAPDVED
jgi:hypothetical protein